MVSSDNIINFQRFICVFEASRGAVAQSVTVKQIGCGFDPHSKRWNIYLNLYFHFFALVSKQSAALSSATQHAMPPEFGRKWGTEVPSAYSAVCGIQRKANLIIKFFYLCILSSSLRMYIYLCTFVLLAFTYGFTRIVK